MKDTPKKKLVWDEVYRQLVWCPMFKYTDKPQMDSLPVPNLVHLCYMCIHIYIYI